MAEHKHQEQDFRAGLQHLANRNQEASAHPVVLVHQHPYQVALAEAALEAHLQHQARVLHQRQVGVQPQQQQVAKKLSHKTISQ